jgi:hypothetical protein
MLIAELYIVVCLIKDTSGLFSLNYSPLPDAEQERMSNETAFGAIRSLLVTTRMAIISRRICAFCSDKSREEYTSPLLWIDISTIAVLRPLAAGTGCQNEGRDSPEN